MVVAASEPMGILRLRICSAAFAAALTLGAAAGPPVKKSETGICHPVTSPYYQRITRFVPYSSMAECIASGGHALKRGAKEPKSVDPLWPTVRRAVDWTADHALTLIAVTVAGVILYQGVRRAVQRWRNRKRKREFAERERVQWEGHRRETPRPQPPHEAQQPQETQPHAQSDDDAVFKHRRHRRDPWLKVLGYFKR